MKMKKITVLIPCYNEEKGIRKVIKDIPKKKLKELEKENQRLKKIVADVCLDKAILKEALSGNF